MKIRKAVIPAAGLGTRLLPATKAMPKEMLPIIDKPVIQYVVQEAVDAGLTDILIITGMTKHAIEDHFDRSSELEAKLSAQGKTEMLQEIRKLNTLANIHYVRQPDPLGLGDALRYAEQHVGNEPFAVLLADDLMVSAVPAIKQLIDVYEKTQSSVIGVEVVADEVIPTKGIVSGKPEGDTLLLDDIVEKPSLEEAPSNLGSSGRYILTPAIFDALKKIKPGHSGEYQLPDAIKLVMQKEKVYAKTMNSKRLDAGNTLGFVKATIELALLREDLADAVKTFMREKVKD